MPENIYLSPEERDALIAPKRYDPEAFFSGKKKRRGPDFSDINGQAAVRRVYMYLT